MKYLKYLTATFRRLFSFKKPIFLWGFDLTVERIMTWKLKCFPYVVFRIPTSFSCPWKPSTEFTFIASKLSLFRHSLENINLFSKAQQPQIITLFCPLAEHRSWWLLSAVAGLQSWSAVSRFSAPILPRQGFEGNHSEDHQNLSVSSFPWCHREVVVSLLATKTQCRKIQEASQGSEPRCQVQPSDVHCRMCHSATSWSARPFCTGCRASWPCCCPWTPWPASPSNSPPERLSPSSPSSPPLAATAGGHLSAPALRSTWQYSYVVILLEWICYNFPWPWKFYLNLTIIQTAASMAWPHSSTMVMEKCFGGKEDTWL